MELTMRRIAVAILLAAAFLSGCHSRDEIAVDGDSHGLPLTITIHYSEEVFAALEPQGLFQPVFVSHHTGFIFAPGFMAFTVHEGYPDTRPAIRAILLAGDQAGDDSLWYWPLRYGAQEATVPIRPGHRVAITLRGEGGERGEMLLGSITPSAAPGQRIDIVLGGGGARIFSGGAPPPPGPPPAPPSGGYPPPPPPAPPPAPPPGQ